MSGKVVGTQFNLGYAGTVSRSADAVIQNRIAGGTIAFGNVVDLDSYGEYVAASASTTADTVAGIAVREVVQANQYDPQSNPNYVQDAPCDVLVRGQVTVKCQRGTPVAGGAVYIRVATNASYPTCVVGGLEASSDTTNTVDLSSIFEWASNGKDANDIAELTVKVRNRG